MSIKEFLEYTLLKMDKYELKVVSVLLLIAFFFIVRFILKFIRKSIDKTTRVEVEKKHALYTLARYVIVVISVIASFQILGFNLSILLAGSAALLVGFGLGMQYIFSDFVSGIILLVESKIKVNDILEVNGLLCRVSEINLRTTTVLARDDKYIILPNTELTRNQIINWTYGNKASRFSVEVGIGYSSDIDLVKSILQEIIEGQAGALKTPQPFIRFSDFGESSLLFSIYFWSEDIYGIENIKSQIRIKIFKKFKELNIEIPFPQRVIHSV
ncbi:MAG: mechanosensitive ion channel domain-containing protein [Ginsengibacter sp.]